MAFESKAQQAAVMAKYGKVRVPKEGKFHTRNKKKIKVFYRAKRPPSKIRRWDKKSYTFKRKFRRDKFGRFG